MQPAQEVKAIQDDWDLLFSDKVKGREKGCWCLVQN